AERFTGLEHERHVADGVHCADLPAEESGADRKLLHDVGRLEQRWTDLVGQSDGGAVGLGDGRCNLVVIGGPVGHDAASFSGSSAPFATSSARRHATGWPVGPTSSGGMMSMHPADSRAYGQRGWKAHPLGGFSIDGGWPPIGMSGWLTSPSMRGSEASSPIV